MLRGGCSRCCDCFAASPASCRVPSVHPQVEDEAKGGGENENLHIRFKREAKVAQLRKAEAGEAGKGKGKGGKEREGGERPAGGGGGDAQQQDGGGEQQLAEVDPEQKVGSGQWSALRSLLLRLRPAAAAAPHRDSVAQGRLSPAGGPTASACACSPRPPRQHGSSLLTNAQRLMEAFAAAAEALKEKAMPVEDRIAKWLRRWMADWEEDLESRPDDIKTTAGGAWARLGRLLGI